MFRMTLPDHLKLADRIEAALRDVDVFAPDTPNLNAWPQPNVRREFAEWLAIRVAPDVVGPIEIPKP